MLPSFSSPQTHFDYASEALVEFREIAEEFFRTHPTSIVERIEPTNGNKILAFRLPRPVPTKLARRATEALLNARHCFDMAFFAAYQEIGAPWDKRNFPWAQNPADLESMMLKRSVPTDLRDVVRVLCPYWPGVGYPGGDAEVREVAKLANTKHTVGIALKCQVGQVAIPFLSVSGRMNFLDPVLDQLHGDFPFIVASPGTELSHDGLTPVWRLVFDGSCGALHGSDVEPALAALLEMAERTITLLDAKCTEVKNRP